MAEEEHSSFDPYHDDIITTAGMGDPYDPVDGGADGGWPTSTEYPHQNDSPAYDDSTYYPQDNTLLAGQEDVDGAGVLGAQEVEQASDVARPQTTSGAALLRPQTSGAGLLRGQEPTSAQGSGPIDEGNDPLDDRALDVFASSFVHDMMESYHTTVHDMKMDSEKNVIDHYEVYHNVEFVFEEEDEPPNQDAATASQVESNNSALLAGDEHDGGDWAGGDWAEGDWAGGDWAVHGPGETGPGAGDEDGGKVKPEVKPVTNREDSPNSLERRLAALERRGIINRTDSPNSLERRLAALDAQETLRRLAALEQQIGESGEPSTDLLYVFHQSYGHLVPISTHLSHPRGSKHL